MDLVWRPLATLDWQALTEAFNLVYQGYVVPLAMTVDLMRQHVEAYDVDLGHSPLWLDGEGAVAALALLGVRGDRGGVGGFGVAPRHRGVGLGHRVARAVQEIASDLRLRTVQLEVLSPNAAAIRTYERAGFRRQRGLQISRRWAPAENAAPLMPATPPTAITTVDPHAVLAHAVRLQRAVPCWQREPSSLGALQGLHGRALGRPDEPEGYLLYRVRDRDVRVVDIAAPEPSVARALAADLVALMPGCTLMLVNEPEDSMVVPALRTIAWEDFPGQHEMVWAVAQTWTS
jgi:GNAT superfamily N-acetyltransferase